MVQSDGETLRDIKPYMSEDPWMNIPLTATEALTVESRPKQLKYTEVQNMSGHWRQWFRKKLDFR